MLALNKKIPVFYYVLAVVLASAFLFFTLAFSELPVLYKVVVLLIELSLTGFVIHKLTGVDSFYGVLIVRGFAGFDAMKYVAKHYGELSKKLCDLGATMGFGVLFGFKVFGWKKALVHSVFLLALLSLLFGFGSSNLVPGSIWLIVAGLIFGLAGAGLFGMISHAYDILTVPNTAPGVSLLLPGVTLPWEAIIAIAIIAVVHELAHGVLCYVEKLPLKASGALFLGFIPIGAFVEPDEKKLDKLSIEKKRRILVAGSTSNLVFFLFFLVLSLGFTAFILPLSVDGVRDSFTSEKIYSLNNHTLSTASQAMNFNTTNPLVLVNGDKGERQQRLLEPVFSTVSKDGPSGGILKEGESLRKFDGTVVHSVEQLSQLLDSKQPGQTVVVETNASSYSVKLSDKKKLGVTIAMAPLINFENAPKKGLELVYGFFALLASILSLTALLNLLVGLVNLLPLFITDGHKWMYYEFAEWFGKKNGERLALAIGIFALLILVLNALPWFWK